MENLMDKAGAKKLGISYAEYQNDLELAEMIWLSLYHNHKVIDPYFHTDKKWK